MRWKPLSIILLSLTLAVGARRRAISIPPLPVAMHRGNPARTGVFNVPEIREFHRIVWQRSIGAAFASPVYFDGVVYVPDSRGRVEALDAETGEPRWISLDLGGAVTAASVTSDAVYVGTELNGVVVLDRFTGQQAWSYTTGSPVFGTPLIAGSMLFVGTEAGVFHAIDVDTRTERWRFTEDAPVHANAASAFGLVFLPTFSHLRALDAMTGAERWSLPLPAGIAAVGGASLFVPSALGDLYAIDAMTGAVRWKTNGEDGVKYWSAPAYLNGNVYASNDRNRVVAFDAATGTHLWQFEAGDALDDPSIAGETIYVGSGIGLPANPQQQRELFAIDLRDGIKRWTFSATGHIPDDVALGAGKVFFRTTAGLLFALE